MSVVVYGALGLGIQLYSNAVRKLPLMRSMSSPKSSASFGRAIAK